MSVAVGFSGGAGVVPMLRPMPKPRKMLPTPTPSDGFAVTVFFSAGVFIPRDKNPGRSGDTDPLGLSDSAEVVTAMAGDAFEIDMCRKELVEVTDEGRKGVEMLDRDTLRAWAGCGRGAPWAKGGREEWNVCAGGRTGLTGGDAANAGSVTDCDGDIVRRGCGSGNRVSEPCRAEGLD